VTGPIFPDVLTFTQILAGKPSGQSVEIRREHLQPGRYLLEIKKCRLRGHTDEFILYPSDQPYVIKKELKAKQRPLILDLTTDYDPENNR